MSQGTNNDYILLSKDFNELWFIDFGREKKHQLTILIDIFLLADDETYVYRVVHELMAERNNMTLVELDRVLFKFQRYGFIEVYKEKSPQRGINYLYIACRHNECIDFDGDETFLDLPLYTFNQGRKTSAYNKWHNACLKRDNFTCQKCGSTSNLHVHHIKPYAKYPNLATTVSNGITLCKKCHIEEHRRWKDGNI